MTVALLWLVGALAVIFSWGLISPRSQWYAFVGWTRDDPRGTEPGSGAYTVSRFVSLVGLVVVASILAGWAVANIRIPEAEVPTRSETIAQRIWGDPRPLVVDRVFLPSAIVPADLVSQKVTGYQLVDNVERTPRYVFEGGKLRSSGIAAQPGFIGMEPREGAVALDTADLIVHVRGDDRCIPQRVVAVSVDGAIQVGVFFGQPKPADGSNAANVSNCDPGPPVARTRGYLVPIDFEAPLGDRALMRLDGSLIPLMPGPID